MRPVQPGAGHSEGVGALDVVVAVAVGVAVVGYVAYGVQLTRVRQRRKVHALEPVLGRQVTVYTGLRSMRVCSGRLVAVDLAGNRLELETRRGPEVVLLSDVRVVEDATGAVRYRD